MDETESALSGKSTLTPEIGSAGLVFGYVRNMEQGAGGGSIGARANLFAQLHPSVAIGPELGYHRLGPGPSRVVGSVVIDSAAETVWHLSGTLRLSSNRLGFRTFADIGLGYYSSNLSFLGLTFGGGTHFKLSAIPYPFSVEVRWHQNIQRLGGPDPKFLTVMAGTVFSW